MHPLDHIVWSALTTQHASFALGDGLARRYPADVAPFAAVREPSPEAWAALATLLTPGVAAALFTAEEMDPPINVTNRVVCEQMIAPPLEHATRPDLISKLGPLDVPDMMELVEVTQPGPFAPKTRTMGTYWGIRIGGQLAAMAGERMHLDGYTEVSAVCVHPDHRGKGYAAELIRQVVGGIVASGQSPMLHVRESNISAIALYKKVGFTVRRQVHLAVIVA